MASRTLVSTGVGLIVLGVAASAYAGPQGRLGSTEIAGGGTLTCFGGSDIDWNELNFICNGDAMPPVGSFELFPFSWDEISPPLQVALSGFSRWTCMARGTRMCYQRLLATRRLRGTRILTA